MKILILSLTLLFTATSYSQIYLTLQPDASSDNDAKIWSVEPDSNFSDDIELKVNAWTWFGAAGTERSLLAFDFQNIPLNAELCYARLSLYQTIDGSGQTNSELSGSNQCHLYRIVDPWSEETVTWNSQPRYSTVNSVVIPATDILYDGLIDIDVTLLVQEMISNPLSGHGFMFKLDDEAYYRRRIFASSDSPDSLLHPKLELCYLAPVNIEEHPVSEPLTFPNPIAQGSLHVNTNVGNLTSSTFAIFNNVGILIGEFPFSQG